jgi:hypothetical protein
MSESEDQRLARQEIALWKSQRLTKMLLENIANEVERLRSQLETIETTDVRVARLQAAITMRRDLLQEPEAWMMRLQQDELLNDFDDMNPE